MSERFVSRAGLTLSALVVFMSIANATVIYLSATAPNALRSYDAPGALMEMVTSLTFALVGGVLTVKRPHNLVGWALMLTGTGSAAGDLLTGYAQLGILYRSEEGFDGSRVAAALGEGNWTSLMAGVFLLLLLFPRGSLPSRRWHTITPLVLAGFTCAWFVIATAPGKFEPPLDEFSSPFSFTTSPLYLASVIPVIAFCLFSTAGAGIDLIVRFRRSRGDERQQYKWLAASAGLLVISMPFAAASNYGDAGGIAISIALIALPISVGISVLRYHLYDIDRIVNRALVYAFLTAMLGALYAGLVVGLQEVLRPLSGGSDLAVVVTTLTVAALFMPARRRVQDVVDRRFNRRQYDAARTVDAFSARLRQQIDLDTLHYELLSLVDETMAPVKTSLVLMRRNDLGTS